MDALLVWTILLLAWAVAAVGAGYLLARLAMRLHPDLSLRRLWAFYTLLVALLAGLVLLIMGL